MIIYNYVIIAYYNNVLSFFGQVSSKNEFTHFKKEHQPAGNFTNTVVDDFRSKLELSIEPGQVQALPPLDYVSAKRVINNYQLQSISAFRYNHTNAFTDTIMNLLPDADNLSVDPTNLNLPFLIMLTPSQADQLVTHHDYGNAQPWVRLGHFVDYTTWPDHTTAFELTLSLLAQQVLAEQVQSRALIPLAYLLPNPFTARVASRVLSLVLNRRISRSNIRRDFQHQVHVVGKDRSHRGNPVNLLELLPSNEDLQRPAKLKQAHRIS